MTGSPLQSAVELKETRAGTIAVTKIVVAVRPKASPQNFALYWIKIPLLASAATSDKQSASAAPPALDRSQKDLLGKILADELLDFVWIQDQETRGQAWIEPFKAEGYDYFCEKQYLPGVTDNLAHTIEEAIRLNAILPAGTQVCSGRGYLFKAGEIQSTIVDDARYKLYHPLTEKFVAHSLKEKNAAALASDTFLQFPERSDFGAAPVQYVNLNIDDQSLIKLSSERLLALSLAEMKAVKNHFGDPSNPSASTRLIAGLEAAPTDVELEIIAQTWSEHCKHKIFGALIDHQEFDSANAATPSRSVRVDSLYQTYIQGPTHELMQKRDDLLSVFEDNSGVVKWSNDQAVCFKVETHNSPSALEPYGGALTGILGVNRDILGTGLGARPIFNTDVFCFAYPSNKLPERPKLLPAKTIMDGVRLGVEDGGNKSGIPTVNGAICFHDGYRAKPLVFCGTGGILPLSVGGQVGYLKHTKVGDRIVVAGGRVGKDGVHGATFSSESLSESSPTQAVQIGDPFTQKRLLDFILEARDAGLITGLTDNGAGGLSSSIGEMATITGGATIVLDNIPLKYPGLSDWEIVVSESQERMSLSTRDFDAVARLARKHNVEVTDIGEFRDDGYFRVVRGGKTIALLDLQFLHKGVPRLELKSRYVAKFKPLGQATDLDQAGIEFKGQSKAFDQPAIKKTLLALLAHQNICSREKIIRRYDHEVQGGSVIKPLMGPVQMAPCDSAVIMPVPGEKQGLTISNGLCPQLSQFDGWLMAICAADEAVRNAVCVGADPTTITLLDNFCWTDPLPGPRNPEAEEKLAILVRACMGLSEICRAYGAPLISGKDSMKNDFDDGVVRLSVPPTLLISAMGKIADASKAISMEFKRAGDFIYLLSAGTPSLAGTALLDLYSLDQIESRSADRLPLPHLKIDAAAGLYRALHSLIMAGYIHSAHDLSEGGLMVALAESVLGSACGAEVALDDQMVALSGGHNTALFGEGPGRIVVSIPAQAAAVLEKEIAAVPGASAFMLGVVTSSAQLEISRVGTGDADCVISTNELRHAWTSPLPFD